MSQDRLKKRWAFYYMCCVKCGTKKVKHHAHGLCEKCHCKERSKTPKRIDWKKKYNADYRQKNKEKLNKYVSKKNKEYIQDKNSSYYHFRKYKWPMIMRFKRFINGSEVSLKKYSGGVSYHCDGCKKNCLVLSPIKEKGVRKKMHEFTLFKKVVIRYCKEKIV